MYNVNIYVYQQDIHVINKTHSYMYSKHNLSIHWLVQKLCLFESLSIMILCRGTWILSITHTLNTSFSVTSYWNISGNAYSQPHCMLPSSVTLFRFIALVVFFFNQFSGQLWIEDFKLQAIHTNTQTTLRVFFHLKVDNCSARTESLVNTQMISILEG